jgi:hypothetical protein
LQFLLGAMLGPIRLQHVSIIIIIKKYILKMLINNT